MPKRFSLLLLPRVGAVVLALGMLGWFVANSTKRGREAAEEHINFSSAPFAPSSKSIGQPIFSVRNPVADGAADLNQSGVSTNAPPVQPDIRAIMAPSSKSAPIFAPPPPP